MVPAAAIQTITTSRYTGRNIAEDYACTVYGIIYCIMGQDKTVAENWDSKAPFVGTKAEILQLNHTQFICRLDFTNKKVGNRKN